MTNAVAEKQKECSRLRLHSDTEIPLARNQPLSFCLRDSAFALHLRHSKMSFSRESLHGPVCFPESITPSEGQNDRFPEPFRRVYMFIRLLYRLRAKKQPTFLWNFPLRASTVLCIFHRKLPAEREISTNCKNSLPKDIDFF